MSAAEAEHQDQTEKMRQLHEVEMEEARQMWQDASAASNGHGDTPRTDSPDSTTDHRPGLPPNWLYIL